MRKSWRTYLLLLSASSHAWAAEAIELSWQAPEECPTRNFVLRNTHIPKETPSRIRAIAVVKKTLNGYNLVLTTEQSGAIGRRSLDAETCGELADVTAALLSLALRPAEEQDTTKEESHSSTSSQSMVGIYLGVHGVSGVLPSLSIGPSVRLAYQSSSLRVELGAFALPRQSYAIVEDVVTNHSLYGGELLACYLDQSSIEYGVCVGFQGGALLAKGKGVSEPLSGSDVWLAPLAQLYVGHSLGPINFSVRPGIGIPLIRPQYRIEPYGEVYQPSVLMGALDISVGLQF